ncbi:MAG: hypothetical protein J5781_00130 [Clostridia bacterium]|nr:hypothetical protein [Clostridia bacterium]
MTEEKEIKLEDNERQPCEQWTRVMGYFRPVENYNKGKKQEFADRKYFSEKKAMKRLADASKTTDAAE